MSSQAQAQEQNTSNSFIQNLGRIPCARTSLLSGIAGGLGFGIIRGLNASRLVAFNWSMGSLLFISLGIWSVCRGRLKEEHERMQVLVDSLPKLRRRNAEELERDLSQ